MTKDTIEQFFKRYERFFMQSLNGEIDGNEISELYAKEFIAASPVGVLTGKNDSSMQQALAQGYEQYPRIGTKEMHIRGINISPIDEFHCVSHVAWTAVYASDDKPETEIDFDVHYLIQELNGKPRIFGWISRNEQELLRQYGIIS